MKTYPFIRHNEKSLTCLARTGDLDAFNQLLLQNQDIAYHHAYALLGDPASAEDAVQESFLKAFQAINGFRGGSFRAWLLKIVTNSAYDQLRRSHRYPTQSLFQTNENGEELEPAAWLVDPAASVQEVVEQNELTKQIYVVLDALPVVYRSVIMLIDLFELDYREAAEILRVPIGTIKSRLARARIRMQEGLMGNENLEINFHPVRESSLKLLPE
ncbi:MAG: RNA polymerase sigma factor [Anaerolineales bacterium]|nr:RNA polymerase sigma factor [Anaerolineales bacterium]